MQSLKEAVYAFGIATEVLAIQQRGYFLRE